MICLGTSIVQNSVTVVLLRIPTHTFVTRTAMLPTLFFHLCSTYSGSKSSPYRVLLDRLGGQYREI